MLLKGRGYCPVIVHVWITTVRASLRCVVHAVIEVVLLIALSLERNMISHQLPRVTSTSAG